MLVVPLFLLLNLVIMLYYVSVNNALISSDYIMPNDKITSK